MFFCLDLPLSPCTRRGLYPIAVRHHCWPLCLRHLQLKGQSAGRERIRFFMGKPHSIPLSFRRPTELFGETWHERSFNHNRLWDSDLQGYRSTDSCPTIPPVVHFRRSINKERRGILSRRRHF